MCVCECMCVCVFSGVSGDEGGVEIKVSSRTSMQCQV